MHHHSVSRSNAIQIHIEDFRLWLQDAGFYLDSQTVLETWNGSVSVEWEDPETGGYTSAEHKVSIILPSEFPYRAPVVISKDQPPLAPSWHFFPEPVCSLCLWNPENGWQPHFTAHWLVNRIQDWFYHYHTDSWPANSEMPDLHRYLENVGLVVIGEEWNPSGNQQNGQFTLWRHNRSPQSYPCLACCDQVAGPLSNTQRPESNLAKNLLITNQHKRVTGVWFRLTKPIVPPNNLGDLLRLIDENLSMERGWAKNGCTSVFGLKTTENGFPIALGYTDDRDHERWLFLWVQLAKGGTKRRRISWSSPNHVVKSFCTAPARKDDLLRRSAYVSKRLGSRKAVIFGVGALGGSVAVLLAKAGIGEIRLVDSDTLVPGNVIRHVCGLHCVSAKKTDAVEWSIHKHNPYCDVHCYDSTWEIKQLHKYIEGCNLVIDTTANHNFSLHLNEVCIAWSQPIIVSAAYRRAAVGRVIVRRDKADPCLACYQDPARFWNEDEYPIIPADPEGTFIEDGCGAVTEEAVALDVEAVANITARIAIKIMGGELKDKNLAILVNEPLPETTNLLSQEGLHWRANTPLANCSICRGKNKSL